MQTIDLTLGKVRNDMNETCAPIPTNLQSLTYEGPRDVHCFEKHQKIDGGPKIEDDEDVQVRIKQESLSPRLVSPVTNVYGNMNNVCSPLASGRQIEKRG